ncbi:alpha/beta hydrolase [Brevundimonas sp.]|uniref:alpha/beta hydrolase n=1 Tax=Brevundimonas sp. TaxID=1871086 RepID=UPI00286BD48D|nr:alpha/beta hydrolase [Brevundimonas sp.]
MSDKPPKSDVDLEAEYNNRAAVPDHPLVMARWRADAEAARAAHPPTTLPYGSGEREAMDLFEAGPDAPVVVFMHGGYWQALDKSWFSWVAPALLKHGVSLAVPSYDLCPNVRLGRIVSQTRDAVELIRARTSRRPVVFGHSAGGHLAACMLSEGRASAAVAISGLFDLAPLIPTSLNDALRLDAREAAALSPVHWPVPNGSTPGGTVLDCVVGADETREFVRQSRDMANFWGGKGVETRFEALPGLNHFTVLDPLADPDSALVKRIAELARAF